MTKKFNDHPANKQLSPAHKLILILVTIAILALAIASVLIIRSQGVTQGLIILTIISIVVGMIIGLLSLMVNSWQWVSSRNPPLTAWPEAAAGQQTLPEASSGKVTTVPLSPVPTSTLQENQAILHMKEDWGEAPHVGIFFGREQELADLKQWIEKDRCQVVAVLGIGGIGKSSLTAKLTEQIKHDFEYIFWRSLQNAQPIGSVLKSCIQLLSNPQQAELPKDEEDQLALLIEYLRSHRCLLILDNLESVLKASSRAGQFREGYEEYGRLIKRVGESQHQSCLLLTSREKPKEIAQLEGNASPVRALQVTGLKQEEGQELLKDKGLFGTDETLAAMIQLYSGNPLALKLAAEPIQEVFGGDIDSFLKQGRAILGDIRDPLDLQFTRLSELERQIMYWLAIEREAVSRDDLLDNVVGPVPVGDLVDALRSLRRRSLIETRSVAHFTLQPVILEYVTDNFVEQIVKEIKTGEFALFESHMLIKAQAKDYVRESQMRLILAPIASQLLGTYGKEGSEARLKSILETLREKSPQQPGYAGGNILNLLIHLKIDLRGYDFSHMAVWQAYLQGVALNDINFADANLAKSVFTEPFAGVLSVALSSDGKRLAAAGTNGEIQQWQVKKNISLSTCQGHDGWIYSIAFSPDAKLLASGSEDRTVRVWEVNTGQCLRVLQGHTNRIWSVAFSTDAKILISGSHDNTVRVWEVNTGQCITVLEGHTNRIWSVAFSPDGKTLASGSDDQTIRLWDIGSGRCLNTLHEHTNRVRVVAFSPDAKMLASGSDDQTVRLWEVATGQCLNTMHEHTYWVGSVVFSADGTQLASGSEDQTVRLWDVSKGQCLKTLHGYAHLIESVAFNAEGTLLASGSDDQAVHLWDVSSGQRLKSLRAHTGLVRSVAINPTSNRLASGSDDQTVRIWNIDTGECLMTLSGHTSRVWSVAFSPDGKTLASSGEDQTIRLWDVSTGNSLAILFGHTSWVWSVTFSPDGKTLVSASGDQIVRLWDVDTGECLKSLHGHTNRVWSVAFSPDGKTLASGSEDQTVRLWDMKTSDCLVVLTGHSSIVRSVAFSSDAKMLASGSDDQTIWLWDVSSGQSLNVLREHTNQVRSVTFSANANNRLLASSSHDGTIKLWIPQTGQCLKTLRSDRPYERMNITNVRGLTNAQKVVLKALGAIEGGR